MLAMFVSNVIPAIIVAGAAGFGFGSADISDMIYMIRMSMVFAGIATLIQAIGMGMVAIALSVGLGLQLEPGALQHLPATAKVLMTSGLLPAALIAILLNIVIPHEPEEPEEPEDDFDMDVATPMPPVSGSES